MPAGRGRTGRLGDRAPVGKRPSRTRTGAPADQWLGAPVGLYIPRPIPDNPAPLTSTSLPTCPCSVPFARKRLRSRTPRPGSRSIARSAARSSPPRNSTPRPRPRCPRAGPRGSRPARHRSRPRSRRPTSHDRPRPAPGPGPPPGPRPRDVRLRPDGVGPARPAGLRWIPAAALFLAFVLTLLPWNGLYPAGYPAFTQSPWHAVVAHELATRSPTTPCGSATPSWGTSSTRSCT